MWASSALAVAALAVLLVPEARRRDGTLALACAAIIVSIWIDKGLGLIVGGLVPSPLGGVADYVPTAREGLIAAGIWAIGAAMVTAFSRSPPASGRATDDVHPDAPHRCRRALRRLGQDAGRAGPASRARAAPRGPGSRRADYVDAAVADLGVRRTGAPPRHLPCRQDAVARSFARHGARAAGARSP